MEALFGTALGDIDEQVKQLQADQANAAKRNMGVAGFLAMYHKDRRGARSVPAGYTQTAPTLSTCWTTWTWIPSMAWVIRLPRRGPECPAGPAPGAGLGVAH